MEIKYLKSHTVQPLSRIIDLYFYEYMFQNLMLLLKGALSGCTKKVNLRRASFDFGFTSLVSHAISPDLVHLHIFSLWHALRISYTDVFVGDNFQSYWNFFQVDLDQQMDYRYLHISHASSLNVMFYDGRDLKLIHFES